MTNTNKINTIYRPCRKNRDVKLHDLFIFTFDHNILEINDSLWYRTKKITFIFQITFDIIIRYLDVFWTIALKTFFY